MMLKDNRGRCIPGCSTYDPRVRIRPARRFHPARETYEAYWHSTPWWVRWINSCQTDWWFPAKIDDFKKTHIDTVKLLSDPFQVYPTVMERTDNQNDSDWRKLLARKICWALTAVMFHQTVTPVWRGMPRISLICLVAVGATKQSNCSREWKTQKRNQGLHLRMDIWQHHCVFRLLLLEQT